MRGLLQPIMAHWPVLLATALILLLTRAIYRLYFHPLSHIPGPKLAAVTSMYCAYHDIILGGQYIWKIKALHEEYGPIIRTMPNVVHVNDPSFIETLYTQSPSRQRERADTVLNMFTTHLATLPTKGHTLHRQRRALISKFFSASKVRQLVPVVNDTLRRLLARMDGWAEEGAVVRFNSACQAATKDVIEEYAFGGEGVRSLDMEDCNAPFFRLLNAERAGKIGVHFPWLLKGLTNLPPALMAKLDPGIHVFQVFTEGLERTIEKIRHAKNRPEGLTVFDDIMRSNASAAEKSTPRMVDEAMILTIAGADTTAITLVSLSYQLLARPDIFRRLRGELEDVMPDAEQSPDPVKLDGCVYLNALIEEALRFYPTGTHRQDRVAPTEDLVYTYPDGRSLTIPMGSIVGMTAPLVNRSPLLCDDPDTFKPERYIEDPKLMHRHLTFSKGGRQCVGINLAYQELQTFTAGIWRKYAPYDARKEVQGGPTLELVGTTEEDVGIWSDYVTPSPKPGSLGMRIRIRND